MTSALKCPRDHQPLSSLKYEGNIETDACGSCQGMWLDQGELEAIQRNSGNDYRKQLTLAEPGSSLSGVSLGGTSIDVAVKVEASGPIRCPKCNTEMETREYAYCSQVMIDVCPEGCGLWLDSGEIQALEVFFERSQTDAPESIPLRWRLWASLHSIFGK